MVTFRFPRVWKGERVKPGDPVEGTQKEMQALIACGQAYDDTEKADKAPTMSNTKKEIEAFLDESGIAYDEFATKSQLLDLIQ